LEENYDELSKLDNDKFSKYLQTLKTEATNIAKTSFSVNENQLNEKIKKELRSQKSQIQKILKKEK